MISKLKRLPKLSPAFVVENNKIKAVIISKEEYDAIQELLEDLEDWLDIEKGKNEPVRDFSDFIQELKASGKKCTKLK